MKAMNHLLFRTLSCRTCRLKKPFSPMQRMMLPAVSGAVLGIFLHSRFPALAVSPLFTQGLPVCAAQRTLWDVFLTAGLPPLAMLILMPFCSTSAFGQAAALMILALRGMALGNALSDCFMQYSAGNGFFAASVLVLPFGFTSVLILANAALEAVRLANSTARYLFRGISDPDITAKQSHLYIKLLTLTLFALIAAGVHTLLCWAMNTWLVSAST